MKEKETLSSSPAPNRSSFVTRLSWTLIVLTGVLALLSISAQITEFRSFNPSQVRGVRSDGDAEIMSNLNWALLVVLILFWASLLYASWSLGRRRSWARTVVVVLFAIPSLGFSFAGVFSLLFTLGLASPSFVESGSLQFQARVVFAAITLVCFAIAYSCWRMFAKLRSAAIVGEFGHET